MHKAKNIYFLLIKKKNKKKTRWPKAGYLPLSNKFLFEINKIFSLRFNATFRLIHQVDIFVVVNKSLVDSIKKYSVLLFN